MFQRACCYSLLLLNSSAGTHLLLFSSFNVHSFAGILLFLLLFSFPLVAPVHSQCDKHSVTVSVSFTASSVAGMVAPCEAQAQSKALPQLHFNSSGGECFPSFSSPPPIRRASLPLSLAFNPHGHNVPLMLDPPSSQCSLASQENGSREAFSYGVQNQG